MNSFDKCAIGMKDWDGMNMVLTSESYAFKTSDISEASGPRILGKRVSINRFAFSSEWQRYTVMIHGTMGMVTSNVHFLLSGMAFYFGQPRAELSRITEQGVSMCPHELASLLRCGVRVRRARPACTSPLPRVVRCHASACTSHCVHVTGHAAGALTRRCRECTYYSSGRQSRIRSLIRIKRVVRCLINV